MKDLQLEFYIVSEFIGNYNKETDLFDTSTVKSRTGYMIMLCGCPIICTSNIHSWKYLSYCESDYCALSQALRDATPIIDLLKEVRGRGLSRGYTPGRVYSKYFQETSSALHMSMVHQMIPHRKHINNVYHNLHFNVCVCFSVSTYDYWCNIIDLIVVLIVPLCVCVCMRVRICVQLIL